MYPKLASDQTTQVLKCRSGWQLREGLAGSGAAYAEQPAAVWRGVFMRDRMTGRRYDRPVAERFYGVACSGAPRRSDQNAGVS